GGVSYYKGKITQKYESYLNNLSKKPVSKKVTPKKPKGKKSSIKIPTTKDSVDKKKPAIKNLPPLNLETKIYEKLTGKNPIYGGRITKVFENWKLKMHKKFQKEVSGKPYYKGALTQKYKKYLSSL
ncbi:MAG: hypothetical protein ACXAAH_07085, partial [Promethearchaeota archaeon]